MRMEHEPAGTRPLTRDEKKDATRAQIQRAAVELFEANGFEATTIDQIVERAGVGRRTFFRYFPSKDATLFSSGVFHHLVDDFRCGLDRGMPLIDALIWAADQDGYGAAEPDEITIKRRRLRSQWLGLPSVTAYYNAAFEKLEDALVRTLLDHPSYRGNAELCQIFGGLWHAIARRHLTSHEVQHLVIDRDRWHQAVADLLATFGTAADEAQDR